MNTPDTEMEKAELAVFWDEMAQHLPKSIERSALGDEKIFRAFATAYPKIKKHLISSRDTYWKERVEEARRKERERSIQAIKNPLTNWECTANLEDGGAHNHKTITVCRAVASIKALDQSELDQPTEDKKYCNGEPCICGETNTNQLKV